MNIGHRGASAYAPENTLAAFDLALSLGAHYLELDVHMSRDGVLVVVHDPTLDRTARGPAAVSTGLIRSRTFDELSHLEFGSWFNEAFTRYRREEYAGLRILSLESVLARYRHCARLCIELKNPEASPGIEDELIRLLGAYGLLAPARSRGRTLILSSDAASLQKLRAMAPELTLMQLVVETATASEIVLLLEDICAYAHAVGPHHRSVDESVVHEAHAAGLHVYPYTVNDASVMRRLIALGVDGMITDCPDVLDALVRSTRVGAPTPTPTPSGW